MRMNVSYATTWLVGVLGFGLVTSLSNPVLAQCSVGTKVADSCGGLSYEGCCQPDGTLQWCEGGVVCAISCSQNSDPAYQKCGWSPSAGFYDCGSSSSPDPSCTHPYDCPGNCVPCGTVTYEGCCNGLVATWCECGCLRTIDCSRNSAPNNTCGWNASEGYYDCGQVGPDPSGLHPLVCGGGPCVPSCGGKQCGDDGCGGSCGTCPAGYVCNASGLCEVGTCVPACAGKQCGPDGCGGSCGTCPAGQTCDASGRCVATCTPNCAGKQCGPDGCGGTCGSCPAGSTCNPNGQCVSATPTYPQACLGLYEPSASTCPPAITYEGCCDSQGRAVWCEGGKLYCLDCAGNGLTCGWSPSGGFYDCDQVGPDPSGQHPISCDGSCTPLCAGKQCGPDGCGGTCGTCPSGQACNAAGQCVGCTPSCAGKQCGPDGCGGTCGACPVGKTCNAAGQCVDSCIPSCTGKQCGDDGCGGTCGSCAHGYICQSGVCVEVQPCTPDCSGKECGPDGCDGTCGICQPPLECNASGRCYNPSACSPSCAGKQCGSDGCGGTCGTCPPGQNCNASGQCEDSGLPDAVLDTGPGGQDASGASETVLPADSTGGCPPGYVTYYGKCVPSTPAEEEASGSTGGGCNASASADPTAVWMALLAFLGLAVLARRRDRVGA